MDFNSEAYLNDQIRKQYEEPPKSNGQIELTEEPFDLDEALMNEVLSSDIDTLQAMVKRKDVTYEEIAKAFYNQVLRNKDSRAVITLNRAVVDEATTLMYDESHDALYGIPILVKDNIATNDMPTTAGAAFLKDFRPKEDAAIIQQLKSKGAIILGKTNLSEWANFMTKDSANGYSAIGGQAKNPHGSFDVGGSSAGSGVAASMQMSPVTIGTETAGSVIYPASQNGVVGLKPTLTTVSQIGIIPIAEAHDTAGPMADTVKDCYYVLKGMSDFKERLEDQSKTLKEYNFGQLDDDQIKEAYRPEDEDILAGFGKQLKDSGANYQHVAISKEAYQLNIVDVLFYQFNEGIKNYFSDEVKPVTLADVAAFNNEDKENRCVYGQDLIEQAVNQSLTEAEIKQKIADHQSISKKALDEAFEKVDVLVTISNYATTLYATSGYPALTLPGYKRRSGEPVGITLIGQPNKDIELLYVGHLIEQAGLLSG